MTSKELIEAGHIWKNVNGSWSKFCPQCKSVIDYTGVSDRRMKDVCRKAYIKQCVCVKCRGANQQGVELKLPPDGVWKNDKMQWCRICPKCSKIVIHKGKRAASVKSKCILAHTQNRPCKICSITEEKDLPKGIWNENQYWCRKCPRCDKVIEYNGEWAKYICVKGLFTKRLCKLCCGETSSERQTGQKRSVEWCKNIGDSKRGVKNPWFGKKRSAEFCRVVSEANKGEKNPWYGRTQPPEMVHARMKALEKNKYQRKEYFLPDGQRILVQGYEPQTLDYLLAEGVVYITTKTVDMPTIMYEWQGKIKRYYPDCFVNNDKLIETKSTYTWLFDEDRNKAKLRAAVMQGYDVVLFIWKNKKELLLKTIFNKNTEPIFPANLEFLI